ncbi:MAG: phage holin family protein [Opitutus sp.]|nr:phage holin family protein [Opitutus sp.]
MGNAVVQLLMRWAVLALGVMLAAQLVPGIRYDDGATLVAVVVLLSFLNAILKPLLLVFTLPFIILTMGLGIVVINALLFLFVGRLVSGFHVDGFWPAVGGALIVSVTNWVVSSFIKSSRQRDQRREEQRRERKKPDDVIDI